MREMSCTRTYVFIYVCLFLYQHRGKPLMKLSNEKAMRWVEIRILRHLSLRVHTYQYFGSAI